MTYHFTFTDETYLFLWLLFLGFTLLLTSCIVAIVLLFFRARKEEKLSLKGYNELSLRIKDFVLYQAKQDERAAKDKKEIIEMFAKMGMEQETQIKELQKKVDDILDRHGASIRRHGSDLSDKVSSSDFMELHKKFNIMYDIFDKYVELKKTIAERPKSKEPTAVPIHNTTYEKIPKAEKVKKTGKMSGEIGTPESKEPQWIPINQRRKRYEKK